MRRGLTMRESTASKEALRVLADLHGVYGM
jgi:hypothetical protein